MQVEEGQTLADAFDEESASVGLSMPFDIRFVHNRLTFVDYVLDSLVNYEEIVH